MDFREIFAIATEGFDKALGNPVSVSGKVIGLNEDTTKESEFTQKYEELLAAWDKGTISSYSLLQQKIADLKKEYNITEAMFEALIEVKQCCECGHTHQCKEPSCQQTGECCGVTNGKPCNCKKYKPVKESKLEEKTGSYSTSVDIETEDGNQYVADVSVKYNIDSNYGADADGHRGIKAYFIDDINIDEVRDEKGQKVTVTPEIEKLINKAVDEKGIIDENINENWEYAEKWNQELDIKSREDLMVKAGYVLSGEGASFYPSQDWYSLPDDVRKHIGSYMIESKIDEAGKLKNEKKYYLMDADGNIDKESVYVVRGGDTLLKGEAAVWVREVDKLGNYIKPFKSPTMGFQKVFKADLIPVEDVDKIVEAINEAQVKGATPEDVKTVTNFLKHFSGYSSIRNGKLCFTGWAGTVTYDSSKLKLFADRIKELGGDPITPENTEKLDWACDDYYSTPINRSEVVDESKVDEAKDRRWMYFVEGGVPHVYPLKPSYKYGVKTYFNSSIHKYFRFKESECFATPEEAWADYKKKYPKKNEALDNLLEKYNLTEGDDRTSALAGASLSGRLQAIVQNFDTNAKIHGDKYLEVLKKELTAILTSYQKQVNEAKLLEGTAKEDVISAIKKIYIKTIQNGFYDALPVIHTCIVALSKLTGPNTVMETIKVIDSINEAKAPKITDKTPKYKGYTIALNGEEFWVANKEGKWLLITSNQEDAKDAIDIMDKPELSSELKNLPEHVINKIKEFPITGKDLRYFDLVMNDGKIIERVEVNSKTWTINSNINLEEIKEIKCRLNRELLFLIEANEILNAVDQAHNNPIGIWWYNRTNKKLVYNTYKKGTGHNLEQANDKEYVRGRLFKDINTGKLVILAWVYWDAQNPRTLTQEEIQFITKEIQKNINDYIFYFVNEYGENLLEKKVTEGIEKVGDTYFIAKSEGRELGKFKTKQEAEARLKKANYAREYMRKRKKLGKTTRRSTVEQPATETETPVIEPVEAPAPADKTHCTNCGKDLSPNSSIYIRRPNAKGYMCSTQCATDFKKKHNLPEAIDYLLEKYNLRVNEDSTYINGKQLNIPNEISTKLGLLHIDVITGKISKEDFEKQTAEILKPYIKESSVLEEKSPKTVTWKGKKYNTGDICLGFGYLFYGVTGEKLTNSIKEENDLLKLCGSSFAFSDEELKKMGLEESIINEDYMGDVRKNFKKAEKITAQNVDYEAAYFNIKDEVIKDLGYTEDDLNTDSIEDEVNRETEKRFYEKYKIEFMDTLKESTLNESWTCFKCGKMFSKDGNIVDIKGETYCKKCAKEMNESTIFNLLTKYKLTEDDLMGGGATSAANFSASEVAVDNKAPAQTPGEPVITDKLVKEEEDKEPEAEKEYLGNNGSDTYFYLYREPGEGAEGIKDLQLLDAGNTVLFSAAENKLDISDVKGFLLAALNKIEVANISYDLVIKYFLPQDTVQIEKPTEKLEVEPEGKDDEVRTKTPKEGPSIQGMGQSPIKGPMQAEAIGQLLIKYGLNEKSEKNFEQWFEENKNNKELIDKFNNAKKDIKNYYSNSFKNWAEDYYNILEESKINKLLVKFKLSEKVENETMKELLEKYKLIEADDEEEVKSDEDTVTEPAKEVAVEDLTPEEAALKDEEKIATTAANPPASTPSVPADKPIVQPGAPVTDAEPVEVEYEMLPDKAAAEAQIKMDYPEEPFTTTAIVYADSLVHDPKVYGGLRKLRWEGIYTDSSTFLKQAKIVGEYGSFSPTIAGLLVDAVGEGEKYKLARNGTPAVFFTIRDNKKKISLNTLKDLVKAEEVKLTGSPGEALISW